MFGDPRTVTSDSPQIPSRLGIHVTRGVETTSGKGGSRQHLTVCPLLGLLPPRVQIHLYTGQSVWSETSSVSDLESNRLAGI